jgi:hypothetical protein
VIGATRPGWWRDSSVQPLSLRPAINACRTANLGGRGGPVLCGGACDVGRLWGSFPQLNQSMSVDTYRHVGRPYVQWRALSSYSLNSRLPVSTVNVQGRRTCR